MKFTNKFVIFLFFIFLPNFKFSTILIAEETGKYDFYYQRIEKVVQLEPETPPQGIWANTKSFFKKGWNFISKYAEMGIRRNIVPGQGKKLWYSTKNPKIAYQVKRYKVRDEKHLLELMGASDGDTSKLSDGQKALLYLYQNSKNPTLKSLSRKAIAPRIIVHLSDTTGFDDASKYPYVRDDFWPISMGLSVTMATNQYSFNGSQDNALQTFVHETAHTTNLTLPNINAYGLDGHHFKNELTKPRSAFQETWSEYQELLFNPDLPAKWPEGIENIKVEDKQIAGKYESIPMTDPRISKEDLFSVEGYNAWVLYKLSSEIPNGKSKVEKAFFHGNLPWRNMKGYLKTFVKMYPNDYQKVVQILKETSKDKFNDSYLSNIVGDPPKTVSSAPALSMNSVKDDLAALKAKYQEAYKAYVLAAEQNEEKLVKAASERLKSAKMALDRALK